MGQRLVVDLIQNDKVVAAIYYHWSAYFASTIYELAKLSKAILKAEEENKDKLFAIIQMLEEDQVYQFMNEDKIRHGGVCGSNEEMEAAMKLFPNYIPKRENLNRNCGIISFTEEGIKDFHDWEEGHAEINLDTHEISNDVDLDPQPYTVDIYGNVSINGKTSPVNAWDCDCESIIELFDFLDKNPKLKDGE